jgi:hypothetical protein
VSQPLSGKAAQLVINEGQQLRRGPGVALPDGIQDARHFIHAGFGQGLGLPFFFWPRRLPLAFPMA